MAHLRLIFLFLFTAFYTSLVQADITCWTSNNYVAVNATSKQREVRWHHESPGFGNFYDPFAIDGTCKIEITAKETTKVYCHRSKLGAPYYDRYNQNFILLIYTNSGFKSMTRLIRATGLKTATDNTEESSILGEAEIDVNELDFDFNKYKREDIYFSIYKEDFNNIDSPLCSEVNKDENESIFDFTPDNYIDTQQPDGIFIKETFNKQTNIDVDFNQKPVCSGRVWVESYNQDILENKLTHNATVDPDPNNEELHYISDGYFYSTSASIGGYKSRLFYKQPLSSETYRDAHHGNNSELFELPFINEFCTDVSFCNNLDIIDASIMTFNEKDKKFINLKSELSLLFVCQNNGLIRFDLKTASGNGNDGTPTSTFTKLQSNNADIPAEKFVTLPSKDLEFLDRVNRPIRYAYNLSSKKLFLIFGKSNEVDTISITVDNDLKHLAISVLDNLIVAADSDSGSSPANFKFYQFRLDLSNRVASTPSTPTISRLYPDSTLYSFSSVSFTMTDLRFLASNLLVLTASDGKLYISKDNGLYFKEVDVMSSSQSIVSLPYKEIVVDRESDNSLFFVDQNDRVFYWKDRFLDVIFLGWW